MRTTKPAYTLLYATLAATFGPLLIYFAAPTQTYWGCTFGSLIVMPIFMDFSLPAATYILSNVFPPHMQGVSSSLIATVLMYSISLGLSIATTTEVHTSVGPTPQLAGIHSAWLTGAGIGALGVLICAIYLFKSILSPPAPTRPPTIHELDVTSMFHTSTKDSQPHPQTPPTKPSAPPSLRKKPSIATSLGLTRHRFSTNLSFAASFPLSRTRRTSASSMESSLFPLTRNSSTSTERVALDPVRRGERDTLTTALPSWRDRIILPSEGRQGHGEGRSGAAATRLNQAQRVHVSQQARYLQGRWS
jgi:hypothetical protein